MRCKLTRMMSFSNQNWFVGIRKTHYQPTYNELFMCREKFYSQKSIITTFLPSILDDDTTYTSDLCMENEQSYSSEILYIFENKTKNRETFSFL